MQMKTQAIPLLRQIMDRFPKATIILDHLSRAPVADGPPYAAAAEFFELAKYEQLYLKVTPINVSPKSWGKGAPETFFAQSDRRVRRLAHRLGLQFSQLRRHAV